MQANTIKIRNKSRSKKEFGSKHRLPFTPKKVMKNEGPKIQENLHVSLWSDMENKVYPKRTVLVFNLLHVSVRRYPEGHGSSGSHIN